ncbi:MAG: hypothetical protein E6I44_11950 [Chloroflexi bacterium]|nr:MAG: hypothetical protein E6I44_11950 [Chloroflexota bacterium]
MFAGQFAGYWRDGKRVVLDRNAILPDRCIKCNEAANAYRRMVKLSYVPTSRELMFGAWAYLSAKRAQIEIGLCERHRRSRAVTVALGSLAVILASMIVFTQVRATDITLPLLATAGLIGGVSGLVYAAVGGRLVRAAKITDTHIWLKGAGEPFLASLPSAPAVGADGALPTLAGTTAIPVTPADSAAQAFRDARNGALLFLVGCLVTAGTYVLLPGNYFIAWGAVLFGLVRLVGALRSYVRVPAEHRTSGQVLALAGIVAVGVVSGGWVAIDQVQSSQFDAAVNTAAKNHTQGATLFVEVANRAGPWTAQDATDMRKVASLYGQAADTLAASQAPASYTWYRDGLVRNFREAADIATQLSGLTSASSQSAFDALFARWTARVNDLKQLQVRLDAQ